MENKKLTRIGTIAPVPTSYREQISVADRIVASAAPLVDITTAAPKVMAKWGCYVTTEHSSLTISTSGSDATRIHGPLSYKLVGSTTDRDGAGDLYVIVIPVRKENNNGIHSLSPSRNVSEDIGFGSDVRIPKQGGSGQQASFGSSRFTSRSKTREHDGGQAPVLRPNHTIGGEWWRSRTAASGNEATAASSTAGRSAGGSTGRFATSEHAANDGGDLVRCLEKWNWK